MEQVELIFTATLIVSSAADYYLEDFCQQTPAAQAQILVLCRSQVLLTTVACGFERQYLFENKFRSVSIHVAAVARRVFVCH